MKLVNNSTDLEVGKYYLFYSPDSMDYVFSVLLGGMSIVEFAKATSPMVIKITRDKANRRRVILVDPLEAHFKKPTIADLDEIDYLFIEEASDYLKKKSLDEEH